jgi:hypothetical protein
VIDKGDRVEIRPTENSDLGGHRGTVTEVRFLAPLAIPKYYVVLDNYHGRKSPEFAFLAREFRKLSLLELIAEAAA